MRKFLLILIVLALAGAGGAYWWSGRGGVPLIAVAKPQALMGQGIRTPVPWLRTTCPDP